MREILFRGKTKENGWVYWTELGIIDFILTDEEIALYVKDLTDELIPETVGQFTGLTDKNGKKIFEGDIVKLEEGFWEATYNAVLIEEEEWYVVYYDDGGARYDLKTQDNNLEFKRVAWRQLVGGVVEIIGNKWDNPELLEQNL